MDFKIQIAEVLQGLKKEISRQSVRSSGSRIHLSGRSVHQRPGFGCTSHRTSHDPLMTRSCILDKLHPLEFQENQSYKIIRKNIALKSITSAWSVKGSNDQEHGEEVKSDLHDSSCFLDDQ